MSMFKEEAQVFHAVGHVELSSPYNYGFVEALRAAVPVIHRSWDDKQKVWIISGEWWPVAREVVE